MQTLTETIDNMSAMVTGLEMKIAQLESLSKSKGSPDMGYRAAGAVSDLAKVLEKEAKIARMGFRAAMVPPHKDDETEEGRRHFMDADEDGSLWSGEYPDAKYKNQD